MNRRAFLSAAGGTLTGIIVLPTLPGCERHTIDPLVKPKPQPFITPIETFFIQNGGEGAIEDWSQPSYDSINDWSLTIKDGNDVLGEIGFDDIMAIADTPSNRVTLLKTIQCVLQSEVRVNPVGYSGNAYWTGIPLRLVLEDAGLDVGQSSPIRRLLFTGDDGFTNNITLDRLRTSDAMGLVEPLLVYRMNGAELPEEHGWPIRLIIQEGFGYKNVKWLKEVQGINFDVEFGTYQDNGYVDDGIMRVDSRSTSLFDRIEIPPGPTTIYGFSVSGYGAIDTVEVSVDGQSGQAEIVPLSELRAETTLPDDVLQLMDGSPYPFLGVWTPWRFEFEATAGSYLVEVKATDSEGNVQPPMDDTIRDGQNGVTKYRVDVV